MNLRSRSPPGGSAIAGATSIRLGHSQEGRCEKGGEARGHSTRDPRLGHRSAFRPKRVDGCLIPARRAARIDPASALRSD